MGCVNCIQSQEHSFGVTLSRCLKSDLSHTCFLFLLHFLKGRESCDTLYPSLGGNLEHPVSTSQYYVIKYPIWRLDYNSCPSLLEKPRL